MTAPEEDTFFAIFQLRDYPSHEFWSAGRLHHTPHAPRGCLHIADLSTHPEALLREPVDSLHLELPRAALDDLAEETGSSRVTGLFVPDPWQTRDPRLASLQGMILSVLEAPENPPPLFTGHLLLATAVHLCETYGGFQRQVTRTGGLAPWQERRARELIASEPGPRVTLGDVAGECGLSMSHFCKAFKVSTGLTPHGWLQRCRLERARDLLRHSDHSLADISLRCDFADQSHFSRIFHRGVGMTPGAWRRHQSS